MSDQNDQDRPPDPLVEFILEQASGDQPPTPVDIARGFAVGRVKPKDGPDAWRRYLNPVKQQILHLARAGMIDVLRNGKKVDPDEARGVTRIRLADPI
ncbi:MAG: DUF3253 domain-containing protein [Pseudomonadota bacterium]